MLVDDHAVFRRGVAAILNDTADLRVIGEANNGSAILSLVQNHPPDVVLMDIHMPEGGGVEAVRALKQCTGIGVLMLTVSEKDEDLYNAIEAGAIA
jgi:DNA-binding NarL/FixJ family response regulator